MDVLVGCEESQEVCMAFRAIGHKAFSCDMVLPSGDMWEWHIQGNVIDVINSKKWDLLIAFPPCTKISNAGARWLYAKGKLNEFRYRQGLAGKDFLIKLLNSPIEKIAIENPTPSKIFNLPPPSQVIQPFQFGDPYSKRTLLWLKNLPLLKPTNILNEYKNYMPSNTGGAKRGQKASWVYRTQRQRSKTFPGIAKAMAEQWGACI